MRAIESAPRLLAIALIGLCVSWVDIANAVIPASQRAVLVAIYNQSNGASWNIKTNWNGPAGTECTWEGVYCDSAQNNVIVFDMRSNNMTGTLPSLSGLPGLQKFDVSTPFNFIPPNQITGSIPSLTGLTALTYLDVSGNRLNGTMAGFAGLASLQFFNASDNQLTGPIPPLTGLTALKQFYVNNNQLSGSLPSLTGLTSLQSFGAWYNQLSGPLPSLSGLPAIQSFEVHRNQLTGTVPPLTGVTTLYDYSVAINQLTGSLPSLGGLINLGIFNAGQNQFTGPLPSLSGLAALRRFDVGVNRLTGSIPSLTGLNALNQFFVNDNLLSGPVPAPSPQLSNSFGQSQLCNNSLTSSGSASIDAAWTASAGNWLSCQRAPPPGIPATQRAVLLAIYASANGPSWFNKTNWNGAAGTECTWYGITCDATQNNVTIVNLYQNFLSGTLPPITDLPLLQRFVVNSNQLTGSIPSLSGLTALQYIYLADNRFTGSVPSLSGLISLQFINAGNNQLTGTIPSLAGLNALQSFQVYGNQLTGSIPALSGLASFQYIDVSRNQLTGPIPSLSGLTQLGSVFASSNQFTGPIPSLSGLTALRYFYVDVNQLTGSIPSMTGLSLQVFVANNNQLTGPLPAPPVSLLGGQSKLCNNSLTSSGVPSVDAAWVTAAGNWQLCQTVVTPPPSCTLTATPNTFAAGTATSVSLVATCTNSPTAYSWVAPAGGPAVTGTGSTVTASFPATAVAGTYTYSVTATNAAGTSTPATATITIPPPRPTCTLTATPNTIAGGTATSVSLVASCTNSPASYSWVSPAGAPSVTGGSAVTASFPATTVVGTYTYSVTATNASGTSTAATATVTVLPPALPICTLTATPNTFAAGTATSVSLVAACTNSPTSYGWVSPAGAPTVSGGSSVTAPFPSTTIAGSYTYSVTATNTSGASTPATATVTVNPPTTPVPVCTLTATPNTFPSGTAPTVSLVAACSNSPTGWTWTTSPGAPAVSGTGSSVTASFLLSTPVGTYTYSVVPRNATGSGAMVSATVTVTLATLSAPVCTLTASGEIYVRAGTAVTLTAACSPAATSYVWTGATCTANTTSVCIAVPPAGTHVYSVSGMNSSGSGFPAKTQVIAYSPTFPMSVTRNITSTTATATAQIQPRPQDVGTTSSVFVFAHVPASVLARTVFEASNSLPFEKADSPDPCVLAQLNSSGRLLAVTGTTMQAYSTGPLQSGQTVPILSNVATGNVAGASFYVGYGSTSAAMLANGNYQGAVSVPGSSQCTAVLLGAAAPTAPDTLTGLWWNPSESGWGVHFTQRRNVVFAAWYSYDAAGNPKWYVASNCALLASGINSSTCNGPLYEVRGTAFFGASFNPAVVNVTTVGSLQVNFQNANAASMSYTVNGQSRTVSLSRQVFASGATPPAVDYTDLWWNPAESGWGMAVTQQYGVMFLAWYVYDGAGKPIWYVASSCMVAGSSCSGTLYRTTGPAFGPSFDPTRVQVTTAGTVSMSFIDANNATLTYTVNGVQETKFITRQVF